jgi:hypothetical protein
MRRRPAGLAKPGADQSAGLLQVPAHWRPAQAAAVFEMLDELRDSVRHSYGAASPSLSSSSTTTRLSGLRCVCEWLVYSRQSRPGTKG